MLLGIVVVWRAVRWMRNVGRLGKWAVRRLGWRAAGVVAEVAREGERASPSPGVGAPRPDEVVVSKGELEKMQCDLERMRLLLEEGAGAAARGAAGGGARRRVVVMRHAKSEFNRSGGAADFERGLSPRGRAEAALVGAELQRLQLLPESVVCSSSVRTVETLRLVRASAPAPAALEPTLCSSLYFAIDAAEMAAAVDASASLHSMHAAADSLLCVSHSPGCGALVEYLSGERVAMAPATAVVLEETGEALEPRDGAGWLLSSQKGGYRVTNILRPEELLARHTP